MTSRPAETQQLIAEIDRLLTNKRLPRLFSNQGSELRQILQRIRDFLVNLSETQAQTQQEQQSQQSSLSTQVIEQEEEHHQSSAQQNQLQQQENTDVVVQQENHPFAAVLLPLQEEIKTLLQERSNLVEEIRQLEQKRLHNYSLAQQLANQEQMISEFLQVLRSRIVPDLTPQATEEAAASSQMLYWPSSDHNHTEPAISGTLPVVESPEQVERLSRLAKDLDQKLLALDGTVNVVFEALQRNIHTYDESLSQALARMHSKGVQGEQLLASFINNLMQQLQQQTSINEASIQNAKDERLQLEESEQFASELPQLKQNNQAVSLETQQENANASDLDAVLSEDRQDAQSSVETPESSTQQYSSPLVHDEVDQLYASLFGVEVTDVTKDKVTDFTDEFFEEPTVTTSVESELTEDKLSTPTSIEITDDLFEESTAITPAQSELTEDKLSTLTSIEITDDLFEESTAITPAQSEVTDVTKLSELDITEVTTAIDKFFDGEQTTTTSEVKTDNDTDVTAVTTYKVTNVIDDSFEEPTLSSSINTSPATTTEQPQSEFLYEVTFEAPQVSTEKVTDVTTSSSVSNLSETSPNAATNQAQQVDFLAEIPDPWLEETQADVVESSRQDAEETQSVLLETKEQSSIPQENTLTELPPVEEYNQAVSSDTTNSLYPASENTITALTELLTDTNPEQSLAAITAPATSETVETPQKTTVAEDSAGEIQNIDVEESLDRNIPASPQENLLSQEENQSAQIVDISLEEALLQQLEEDLASFDGEINALLQPLTKSENQEQAQQLEISPNSNTIETQAELEKNTPEEKLEGSSVSISGSIDNPDVSQNARKSIWYLGIDLGTTGISAALLNRSTTEVYPLYWEAQTQSEESSLKQSFRLPAEVYLPTASVSAGETESSDVQEEQTAPAAVAKEKVPENMATDSISSQSGASGNNLFSAQLKPYMQVALPYKNEQQKWEPVLQLNDFSTVPLVWVVRSLSKLLLTLMEDRNSTTLSLTTAAVGLEPETFSDIIRDLTGVICTCPSNWSEQYRFNIREAILISKLVQHPQQVFFVEEGIACLLCELDGAEGEIVKIRGRQGTHSARSSERPLVGNTFVLNIGAGTTEMAIVDLPENLEDLTHSHFMLHGFAYAGIGLEQDIICQLLLPSKWRQSRTVGNKDTKTTTTNSKNWQPAIPGLEQMSFSSLSLEELNLPRAGEPDVVERIRLKQRLESSLLGKAIIDAAIALKLILQHQESFTIELADQQWFLQRRDLESQVFVPFVRRLNRELNKLLVAKGIPTEAINQAILTGGVACLGAVSRWLRQKLPNAKMIQHSYLGENGSPTCSRVAYGLAVLPLHPQVLDVPRQQYTDYFLFTELLRILPSRAISFGEVIQLFENRGINTRSCQQRLLAFLEGELPPGLIPTSQDAIWLTQASCENSDYKAITAAPLFEKQGSLTYRPNAEQLQAIARYLDVIKASIQQSLEEPYTVNFALGVFD
ncbi:hypothetical protein [Brasilonema sp. UFV-L1]|uniref:hypothetical protein n=1 Tax=Brasilonema sp. UFV-L1 TaxID=2234130 RepID=UPI00145C7A3C|nr:hypothetical protein [Brasilonema sp. UFV-L1]NMG05348.1 hypothetical protein [Brasilonema sp. UFV-L1]